MAEVAEDLRRFQAGEPLAVASSSGSGSDGEGQAYNPAHAAPGQRIGGYSLLALLGKGAQAEVWEAEEEKTGGSVALKLLAVEGKSQAELDRFEREARAGAKRMHSGLIHVHAAGFEGAVHWIAMELVAGGRTVRDVIRAAKERGQRTVVIDPAALDTGELFPSRASLRERYRRVALFFAELAEALAEMHRFGILHRDLKPANVLVTQDLHPKVADFGSARLLGERTLYGTGELAGTPRYMAPEQLDAKYFEVDERSDVFGLGVMLYEVLSLQHPFEGDDRVVVQKILREEPPPLSAQASEVPSDLAVIAHKCLEKLQAERYASMAEVAADLRRHLADLPILAWPPSAWQRALKWTRRNPAKSAAGAVGAVAFALVSALALVARGKAEDARVNAARADENARTAEARASEAKASAEEARAKQALADRKTEDVLSLSAGRRLDELVARAAKLWPALPAQIPEYEGWRADARELIDGSGRVRGLAQHRSKLAEIRARALEPSEEERERALGEHPEIGRLERKLRWTRRVLAIRAGGADPLAGEPLELGELPADADALNALAWPLVDPEREEHGREREGLELAGRAAVLSPEDGAIADTLAWALFANGLDEEALAESQRALAAAPAERTEAFSGYRERMRALALERAGAEGLARLRAGVAALEAELARRVAAVLPPRFTSEEDTWWHGELSVLVERLEAFSDKGAGLLSAGISAEHGWGVERRLASARALLPDTLESADAQRRWEEALASIADRAECPLYGGLELLPQLGLLPIGRDSESLLWEFWHVQSGAEPKRDPATGKLVIAEESGLVFVLIPGGSFWMGAQSEDPGGRNYDPQAQTDELPVREVALDAFFLSKYELTQGQWLRFRGRNPSGYKPKSDLVASLVHPVEQVSWEDCDELARRLGLVVATEAQWEYAARAGTGTPWWTGAERESLDGVANLADRTWRQDGVQGEGEDWLEDGYVVHGPVGRLRANAFGLHDVHGNVYEWCRDWYCGDAHELRAGDGERVIRHGSSLRVFRGGSWFHSAWFARSAYRFGFVPGYRCWNLGFRPARVITE